MLLLASSSPRRLDLLRQAHIEPGRIMSPEIDETPLPRELPRAHALRIAEAKARAGAEVASDAFVLAADTVVACGRRILPKAEARDQAQRCLDLLSGRRHRVHSGICVVAPGGRTSSRVVTTMVRFKRLSTEESELYLDSGEWQGKAGGYAIQGLAGALIPAINGSYSNVVGLPLTETIAMLTGLGLAEMTRSLVIESTGFGMRGAVLDGDRLIELLDVDTHGETVTDTLFAARVEKVDRPLAAAFVEIGLPERAFLAAKDARAVAGVEERLPVDRLLQEGQRLIVQGMREPLDGKGSRVTSDLKLFGFGLILRPMSRGVEVPARLPERQREALAARGRMLFGEAGVTLRRAAATLDDEALRREHAALNRRWGQIEREAREARRPGRLTADEPPIERLLRRAMELGPQQIVVADQTLSG